MASDFEKAKALLKTAGPDGVSLYDHLTSVLLKITQDKPGDALKAFEAISAQVKSAHVKPDVFKEQPVVLDAEEKKALLAAVNKVADLCKPPPRGDDDPEEKDASMVPDLMAEAELLEWAGFSLGKEETYKLMRSIQELAKKKGFVSVRFFGKFFGTKRDYYVIETKLAEPAEDPESSDPALKMEAPGKGANEFTYFAANRADGNWTQLPNVRPDHITTARAMRRYLTGDLDAPVLGFPRFHGRENAYLRAQIARIAAATVVSPKGFFSVEGEGDEETMNVAEDFEPLPAQDMLQPENWAHHRQFLLKQGRCVAFKAPEAEGGDDEAKEENKDGAEEEEEAEEPKPLLSSLDGDNAEPLTTGCWAFRSAPPVVNPHAVSIALSMTWPGAVTVVKKKAMVSVYFGHGLKQLPEPYTPPPPPAVMAEYRPAFNADEGEADPLSEQNDPQPPPQAEQEADKGEGDEDDEADENAAAAADADE